MSSRLPAPLAGRAVQRRGPPVAREHVDELASGTCRRSPSGGDARKRKIASGPRYAPAIAPSPGTRPDGVGGKQPAERERIASRERVEDPADDRLVVRRISAARARRQRCTGPLPLVDEPLDMAPLGVREVEPVEQPTRFGRIVVRDRRLEVLTLRRRLAELAAKPAQEAHGGLLRHRAPLRYWAWTRSWRSTSRRDQRRYQTGPSARTRSSPASSIAGRLSGSGSNRQPWTFVIVESRERIEALAAGVYAPGTSSARGSSSRSS